MWCLHRLCNLEKILMLYKLCIYIWFHTILEKYNSYLYQKLLWYFLLYLLESPCQGIIMKHFNFVDRGEEKHHDWNERTNKMYIPSKIYTDFLLVSPIIVKEVHLSFKFNRPVTSQLFIKCTEVGVFSGWQGLWKFSLGSSSKFLKLQTHLHITCFS